MNGLFFELRNLSGGAIGVTDVACPWCGPQRRSPVNRRRKVLRIWDDGDFITFKCIRCEETGWARDGSAARVSIPRHEPPPKVDRTELVTSLWKRSLKPEGTPVETYLRSRKCWLPTPNIRFLPGNDKHPPSMIARFDQGCLLRGVHITRLMLDGTGKAGTENDKVMIGDTRGLPIVVNDPADRDELIITEGIEDALSFAVALGWCAWAAGSSAHIPHIVAGTGRRTYVAVDNDTAGKRALARARTMAPVIPVKLGMLDANGLLCRHGAAALVGAVEWCDLQQRFREKKITLNQLMRGFDRLAGLIPTSPD